MESQRVVQSTQYLPCFPPSQSNFLFLHRRHFFIRFNSVAAVAACAFLRGVDFSAQASWKARQESNMGGWIRLSKLECDATSDT